MTFLSRRDDGRRPSWRSLAPLGFLFALIVAFSLLNPNFLDPNNLFNVMRQVSITGLIALGMTFVILTGGIDLSVGSILAFAGIMAAIVAKGGAAGRFARRERATSARRGTRRWRPRWRSARCAASRRGSPSRA